MQHCSVSPAPCQTRTAAKKDAPGHECMPRLRIWHAFVARLRDSRSLKTRGPCIELIDGSGATDPLSKPLSQGPENNSQAGMPCPDCGSHSAATHRQAVRRGFGRQYSGIRSRSHQNTPTKRNLSTMCL
uniref:Uncharacterized protein n=1 Tax=Eutreptiella gymnastica TaxID=73025 RepID=A0A6T1YRU1_9EUGL